MNLRDPDQMNDVLSEVLRYGILASAAVLIRGAFLLLLRYGSADSSNFLTYFPNQIPHSAFTVSPSALFQGVAALDPFAVIELGGRGADRDPRDEGVIRGPALRRREGHDICQNHRGRPLPPALQHAGDAVHPIVQRLSSGRSSRGCLASRCEVWGDVRV
ncbi:MAG: DUF1634 domain-containing protein [Nitrososphaerota archaeon]|nr:DUF1634 domain-containing protein [Nitrososphaerota archaeon]MDG6973906.1 DUF1634 domain-containing protein [Nitrososphaerota archaeon]MDG7030380.1 DUF1634 domain-containing protein [Nitrososphaerota archaeon]